MQEKPSETAFFFIDNSIWIAYVELSLLRRKYLSSAVNVLTNSPKIFHISKINFFQPKFLDSDQWI